ncbi:hypothetical protein JCGZ_09395 [Jatropha curcas]|uniref:Transmembrane protein n=1 Tax=Jatropha curcas TaxID=180498 RepID=A0A067KGA7_JATCU|nr:uncharacterized protein LOC105636535 [Jatropha curcas]KDP35236.1 hypothetical protein JCGZ_09395 [Jatropha curcas]
MFDLGDNLTIETYRIPWLIWIQIIIFFLLIFLVYSFTAFSSDLSHTNSSPSPSSPSLATASTTSYLNKEILKHNNNTTVTNRLQLHQVGERQSIKGEIATGTSSRRIITEESREREGFSTNAIIEFHPCDYFRLAKLAFLKCFGLDSTSDQSSSSSDRKKER